MGFVEEKSNEKFTKRCYRINRVRTIEDAVTWISNLRENESVYPEYIYLGDVAKRPDGTNDSVQLSADISTEALQKSVNERFVDWILLFGKYEKSPVVFGVHLSQMLIYVLTMNDDPTDMDAIEGFILDE